MRRPVKAFIGIDPGKKGSFCMLTETKNTIFRDWPKDENLQGYHHELTTLINTYQVCMAVLEKVHAMPKQGVSSMFTFGTNYGIWRGWLIGWGLPHLLVAPQTWMKGLTNKADGNSTKLQVNNAAQRMFPEAHLSGPRGGYLDGRGDSLLMAYYGMLKSGDGFMFTPEKTKPKRVSKPRKVAQFEDDDLYDDF